MENIRAAMSVHTDITWLEHDDKEYEDKYEVFEELKKRYNITSRQTIVEMAEILARELRERSGASLREIASLFEMGRETLRKRLKPRE